MKARCLAATSPNEGPARTRTRSLKKLCGAGEAGILLNARSDASAISPAKASHSSSLADGNAPTIGTLVVAMGRLRSASPLVISEANGAPGSVNNGNAYAEPSRIASTCCARCSRQLAMGALNWFAKNRQPTTEFCAMPFAFPSGSKCRSAERRDLAATKFVVISATMHVGHETL